MKSMSFLLVLVVLARTACDLSFKASMQHLYFDSLSSVIPNIKKVLLSPFIYFGFFFGGLNFIVWSLALTHFDLSYAYPFLSISYLTIMVAGKFIFHEHFGKNKIMGLCFIVSGTIVLFLG